MFLRERKKIKQPINPYDHPFLVENLTNSARKEKQNENRVDDTRCSIIIALLVHAGCTSWSRKNVGTTLYAEEKFEHFKHDPSLHSTTISLSLSLKRMEG